MYSIMLPLWCCLRFVIDFQSEVQEPPGVFDKVPGVPKELRSVFSFFFSLYSFIYRESVHSSQNEHKLKSRSVFKEILLQSKAANLRFALSLQPIILWVSVRGLQLLSFRDLKVFAPPTHTHFLKRKSLAGQTGLLQRVHGPIMCRQTKAEAASKSFMQNLCSCGCFSGWKNQYCGA